MIEKIDLVQKLSLINDYYSPKIVGQVNDVSIKLVKIKGDKVPWHNHQDEDEMFYILKGSLLFEIENQATFMLSQGEMLIVPREVNHRVSSNEECLLMLVEPSSTKHTGDIVSDITKSIEDQIM